MEIIKKAHRAIHSESGGFSFFLFSGDEPKIGWAVAVEGYEVVIPLKLLTEEVLKAIYDTYQSHSCNWDDTGETLLFGGWWDENTGLVYLDISELVFNKGTAIAKGILRKQIAIHNIATGEDLIIEKVRNKIKEL